MSLARKMIRRATSQLLAGRTIAGDRVYEMRLHDLQHQGYPQASETPGLVVFTQEESSEIYSEAPRRYRRLLELAIEGFVDYRRGESKTAADKADDLAQQVENVLDSRLHFPNLDPDESSDIEIDSAHSFLQRTSLDVDERGRAILGAFRQVWQVAYITTVHPEDRSDVKGSLGDLETLHVDWDFPPPDEEPEAEDDNPLPQD